jgi:hypothetical protein
MAVVQFLSRYVIRRQAFEDAARILEGLAKVTVSNDATKAHLRAADILRTMAKIEGEARGKNYPATPIEH